MQFLNIIAMLAATAAASAVPSLSSDYSDYTAEQKDTGPVDVIETVMVKRQSGRFGLYACNSRYFNSHEGCTSLWTGNDQCHNMPPGYIDSISSIGPNAGATCHLFDNINCQEDQGAIYNVVSPGFSDLSAIQHPPWPTWEDHIASYRCWW